MQPEFIPVLTLTGDAGAVRERCGASPPPASTISPAGDSRPGAGADRGIRPRGDRADVDPAFLQKAIRTETQEPNVCTWNRCLRGCRLHDNFRERRSAMRRATGDVIHDLVRRFAPMSTRHNTAVPAAGERAGGARRPAARRLLCWQPHLPMMVSSGSNDEQRSVGEGLVHADRLRAGGPRAVDRRLIGALDALAPGLSPSIRPAAADYGSRPAAAGNIRANATLRNSDRARLASFARRCR